MTKFILTLLSVYFYLTVINAQPSIEWEKSFGGTQADQVGNWNNDYDSPDHCIIATPDHGFAFCGFSNSSDGDLNGNHGNDDIWVVKSDSVGNIEWQKNYGGSGNDRATSIVRTSDGGFAICGYSSSNDDDILINKGGFDFVIIKIDGLGSISWVTTLGGALNEEAFSISQTSDDGYIVGGVTNSVDGDVSVGHGSSDYWLTKIDNNGVLLWEKTYGGTGPDWASSVKQTPDHGIIIAGFTGSTNGDVTGNHGSFDCWVVKTDSVGNLQWQNSYGGTAGDWGTCIINTYGGGYAFSSFSSSVNGDVTGVKGSWDFWLVKISDTGIIEWQKTFGGTSSDEAYDVFQTADSGFVLTGASNSVDGDLKNNFGSFDYWVMKTDVSGNFQWQQSFGGSGGEWAVSGAESSDHGILIAGSSSSNNQDVSSNHGSWDMWIVKLPSNITGVESVISNNSYSIFPNPCSNFIRIMSRNNNSTIQSVEIYNLLGEKMFGQSENKTVNLITVRTENLSSGIYIIKVITEDGFYTKSFIKN